jgi:long-chain-fatty-acid--CoA ligase ACSBG
MDEVKPGNCCTLVYTSGTTGMPKGVILSHYNYVWLAKSWNTRKPKTFMTNDQERMVSYLPLSHVAAQYRDIAAAMMDTWHVYFAEPTAIQGTLIETLK